MYKHAHTKMRWQCSQKHEWVATFHNIKTHHHWCPTCGKSQRLTLDECQQVAQQRGGECLSETYNNSGTKMRWRCAKGHEWQAIFGNIKHLKNWCPQCSNFKSEQLCREIFEKLLLEQFPKVRPKWLKGLELDGYCEKLNIGFEYNGILHYEYNEFFHRGDPANFEKQRQRDKKKYQLCKERGLHLITIPYTFSYQNQKQLEVFIQDELWKIC
jgi:hypothetical protein